MHQVGKQDCDPEPWDVTLRGGVRSKREQQHRPSRHGGCSDVVLQEVAEEVSDDRVVAQDCIVQ